MGTLADRTIDVLRGNSEDLAGLVRNCDESGLARQSGASEWDVAQVLSHLGSGAEITLAGLRAGLDGQDAPGSDFNEAVWDRWNAMGRREKADAFLSANEQLVTVLEQLDATVRQDLRISLPFVPFPADLALFAGMRLHEAALHAWDIRVAFDPAAGLSDPEAETSLDLFLGPLSFLAGFVGKPQALGTTEAALRVETTNPQRIFGLILGPAIIIGDAPSEPDGVLSGPAEAYLRLLAGRLDPARTPDALVLASDVVSLDELRAVFPGY